MAQEDLAELGIAATPAELGVAPGDSGERERAGRRGVLRTGSGFASAALWQRILPGHAGHPSGRLCNR